MADEDGKRGVTVMHTGTNCLILKILGIPHAISNCLWPYNCWFQADCCLHLMITADIDFDTPEMGEFVSKSCSIHCLTRTLWPRVPSRAVRLKKAYMATTSCSHSEY